MPRRAASRIEHELDRIRALSVDQLRREWEHLYRASAPRISRELLILGLAYRLQERAFGGLSRAAERKLTALAAKLRAGGQVEVAPKLTLKPGSRLVREWRGRMHVVTVLERGYEHGGAVFDSLSSVAKQITGAHRSGPRFFGLLRLEPKRHGTAVP